MADGGQYQLLRLQNYIQFLVPIMEEQQVTVPVTVTFEPQFTTNKQSITQKLESTTINKHNSQPKFRTYKQEILKIPKVKQILNKDRYIYSQDMEKRLELIGSLKSDNYEQEEMFGLNDLRMKVDKKTKRHKTNFKIPLTRKNMESLNQLILKNIGHNQKFKNEEVIFLKEYTQNAPFDLEQLKFIDKIDQVKVKFSEKYPDLNQKVLSKNKLTLQNVILNRNIKREIKLDNKKAQKLHSLNVFSTIKTVNDPKSLLMSTVKKPKQKNS